MDLPLKDDRDLQRHIPYDLHTAAPMNSTMAGTAAGPNEGNDAFFSEAMDSLRNGRTSSNSSFSTALAHLASTHEQEVVKLRHEISQLRGEVAALKSRSSEDEIVGVIPADLPQVALDAEEVLFEVAEELAYQIAMPPSNPKDQARHGEQALGEGKTSSVTFSIDDWSEEQEHAAKVPQVEGAVRGSTGSASWAIGDSIRSSLDTSKVAWDNLPPVVARWVSMVEGLLENASTRRHYALRDDWVKSDQFMKRMERIHGGSLDLQVLTMEKQKPPQQRQHRQSLLLPRTVEKGNCLLHPSSKTRLIWIGVGMTLVVYDIVVLPLNAFPLPQEQIFSIIQWFAQIFWTLDIVLTFMTATYKDGELVKDWQLVAKIYSRTWLAFDLIVVLPLWLVVFAGAEGHESRSTTLVKYVRMLRFMRLARLAKIEKYLNEVLGALNSSMLLLTFGMVKLIIMMVVVVHFIACLWYAVGSAQRGGWVDKFKNHDLGYLYITSMHWSFSQFQGTSDILPGVGGQYAPFAERCVATFTILVSLVILSSFVSSLTNIMLRIQSVRTQMNAMDDAVRLFLSEYEISWHLSLRVKKYVDWNQRMARRVESSNKVVEILPKALQMDLHEEVRGPLIVVHRLFQTLQSVHTRLFRQLCFEALETAVPAPSEIIFSQGEVCHCMYFITVGRYRYVEPVARHGGPSYIGRSSLMALEAKEFEKDEEDSTVASLELAKGRYLSEACLWVQWEHFGIFMGMKNCAHCCLAQKDFSRIAKDNPTGHASVIVYARRYVGGLNRFGKKFTDVIDNRDLCEHINENGEGGRSSHASDLDGTVSGSAVISQQKTGSWFASSPKSRSSS